MWARVSHQTARQDGIVLMAVLIVSLLVIHLATSLWVDHNKRLAAHGNRGAATRYISPVFSHDHLNRTLLIDESVRHSQEIIISIEGDRKIYSAANSPR